MILIDSVFRPGKIVTLKYFYKNVNTSLKKKDFLLYHCWCRKFWWRNSYKADSSEEHSDKEIFEKIQIKNNSGEEDSSKEN